MNNPLNKFTELSVDPEKPPADTTQSTPMPPGTAEPTPREKKLLTGLYDQFGYTPQMPINAPDSLNGTNFDGFVDRESGTIALHPSNAEEGRFGGMSYEPKRGNAETMSHELTHLLHKGTVPQDSLQKMWKEEAEKQNVPSDSVSAVGKTLQFRKSDGTEYASLPQERFSEKAEDSLRYMAGFGDGGPQHPTEKARRSLLGRLIRERVKQNQAKQNQNAEARQ